MVPHVPAVAAAVVGGAEVGGSGVGTAILAGVVSMLMFKPSNAPLFKVTPVGEPAEHIVSDEEYGDDPFP